MSDQSERAEEAIDRAAKGLGLLTLTGLMAAMAADSGAWASAAWLTVVSVMWGVGIASSFAEYRDAVRRGGSAE